MGVGLTTPLVTDASYHGHRTTEIHRGDASTPIGEANYTSAVLGTRCRQAGIALSLASASPPGLVGPVIAVPLSSWC